MFLIKTTENDVYWTDSYTKEDDFYKFETISKKGKKATHLVNKVAIQEILETETTKENIIGEQED